MNELNICIDIDGTITDPYYWLDYANKYFNLDVKKDEVTQYSIAEVMSISEDQYLKFYEDMKFEIHLNEQLRHDVKTILNELYLSNNIFFVTARDKSLELLTAQYLISNKIYFNDLFVLGHCNKSETAKSLNCDIFIEDSYDNAVSLAKNGFNVLLIDTTYNRFPLIPNITRVYNWKEIFQIINNMSKKEEVI